MPYEIRKKIPRRDNQPKIKNLAYCDNDKFSYKFLEPNTIKYHISRPATQFQCGKEHRKNP